MINFPSRFQNWSSERVTTISILLFGLNMKLLESGISKKLLESGISKNLSSLPSRFQSLIVLSPLAVAIHLPSWLKIKLLTSDLWPVKVLNNLPSKFQIFILLSLLAVAINLPSGLKRISFILSLCPAKFICNSLLFFPSICQSLIFPSLLPDTRSLLSGLKLIVWTSSIFPSKVLIKVPSDFHSLIVLSSLAEAIILASGLNFTSVIGLVCPSNWLLASKP